MANSSIEYLIAEINAQLNFDKTLVGILQKVIEIASKYNHQNVIDWANRELSGYKDASFIPSYREIVCTVYEKEFFTYIRKRLITKSWDKPISEILYSMEKKETIYDVSEEDRNYKISISKNDHKQIVEGIKGKIKEYVSKVLKDPNNLKIDFKFTNDEKLIQFNLKKEKFIKDITTTKLSTYLNNDKEVKIFQNNLISLVEFEFNLNYKYCMIAMGAILEFLLKKYCISKKVKPEPFNSKSGKDFANYIEAAIKINLFDEKSRWKIVQSHLREFRNYVHIEKEINSPKIDEKWQETMKPVFEVLYEKFKVNDI